MPVSPDLFLLGKHYSVAGLTPGWVEEREWGGHFCGSPAFPHESHRHQAGAVSSKKLGRKHCWQEGVQRWGMLIRTEGEFEDYLQLQASTAPAGPPRALGSCQYPPGSSMPMAHLSFPYWEAWRYLPHCNTQENAHSQPEVSTPTCSPVWKLSLQLFPNYSHKHNLPPLAEAKGLANSVMDFSFSFHRWSALRREGKCWEGEWGRYREGEWGGIWDWMSLTCWRREGPKSRCFFFKCDFQGEFFPYNFQVGHRI